VCVCARVYACVCVCVCAHGCVCERERYIKLVKYADVIKQKDKESVQKVFHSTCTSLNSHK